MAGYGGFHGVHAEIPVREKALFDFGEIHGGRNAHVDVSEVQMQVRPRGRRIDIERLAVEEAGPRGNAGQTWVLLSDDGVKNGVESGGEEKKRGSGVENGLVAALRLSGGLKKARK